MNPKWYLISATVALVLSACLLLTPAVAAQIQPTINCPSGHGYWDTLSVMMMDPGLAAGNHMQGTGSYMYTAWWPNDHKVWLIKNSSGFPWDVNLYDSQPSIPA